MTRCCGSSRPSSPTSCPTRSAAPTSTGVDLAALVVQNEAPPPDVFDDLTAYLLGFDLDPAAAKALRTAYRRRVEGSDPADHDLLAREDAFLDLFADIGSLYRPRTEAEASATQDDRGPDQHPGVRARVPPVARPRPRGGCRRGTGVRLERVLARYGVEGRTTGPCSTGDVLAVPLVLPGARAGRPRHRGAGASGWTSLVSC